jgi:predicted TIM-barrel fold metal-dependent hydrolase
MGADPKEADMASGRPSATPAYRLIDTDTHVNEPPDLWTSRVPAKFTDSVPRLQRFEQGDAWVLDGVKDPINFGFNASATLRREDRRAWIRFEDMPRGGYDPAVRLEEMDADLVDAAVLYPTPRLSHLMIAYPDPELHLSMVRAYNDWLIEYASHDPSRLGAIALIPNRGVDQAVAEIRRVAAQRSVVGLLLGCYPHGDRDLAEEDDPVWRTAVEVGLPVHIHVSLVDEYPEDIYAPGRITAGRAAGDLRFLQAPALMVQFLNGGVFERVPELHVVFVEVDAGWVPYVKEQLDNRFRRRAVGRDARLRTLPSQVIEEHFSFTYITDSYAVENRHRIGVDRLMWSSDFPHGGSDWPDSWRTIDATFATIPAAERDQILAGNAQRLYKFDQR